MPKKEKKSVLDYLDTYAYNILKAIASDDKAFYTNIMEKSGLVRSNFNRRLNELLELGLIKVTYVEDPDPRVRRPRALYLLTPTGRKILELLEEILKVYEEKVSLEEKELKWIEDALSRQFKEKSD